MNEDTGPADQRPGNPDWPDWMRRLYTSLAEAFEGFVEIGCDWIEEPDPDGGPSSFDLRVYQNPAELEGTEVVDPNVRIDLMAIFDALDEVHEMSFGKATDTDDDIVTVCGKFAGHHVLIDAYLGAPADARATWRIAKTPNGGLGFEPIVEN